MTSEQTHVYVLVVTYRDRLAQIDAAMEAHRRFLDRFYATGEFLVSGPRHPRTGESVLHS